MTQMITKTFDDITHRLGEHINGFLKRNETTWKDYKSRQKRRATLRNALKATKHAHETDTTSETRKTTRKWSRLRQIVAFETTIMTATNSRGESVHDNFIRFDTDSASIGIDNRASACISHRIEDFDGPVHKVNRAIKGFGGERTTNVFIGTIVWKWCDDEGLVHKFRIPNSYYVPDGNVRLLSPQHWAKTQKGSTRDGIGETTTSFQSVLFWNNRKHRLTVHLSKKDNVATFFLAPGYKTFDLFCQKAEIDYNESVETPLLAQETQPVSDDEHDDGADDDFTPPTSPKPTFWSKLTGLPRRFTPTKDSEEEATETTPVTTMFNLDGPTNGPKPVVIEEEEDKQPTTATQELLRYHHRFGHVSFAKLQNMAKQNILPRHLADCQVPTCTACLYAKATRRRWRSKTAKNWDEAEKAQKPGDTVSVDQLVSPTPGLVAQLTGRLTTKRYKYATVYVDQFSGFSFVYLQKSSDADETILGKKAFEAMCRQHGITVRHYHADNGIFRASKWVEQCMQQQQRLTFAGVNAHHSNGLAERRIRSLQDLARSMLLHANKRWPDAVTTNLWPYAVRMACDAINEAPNMKDETNRSPLQIFTGSETHTNVKHWKPFGCPIYVLDTAIQSGRGIHHKWKQRSRVGIYLGRSPQHGRNVALVLDRNTGLVSPQFHVSFDPGFYTVKQDKFDTLWQTKAGFVLNSSTKKTQTKQIPSDSDRSIKRKHIGDVQQPEGADPKRLKTSSKDHQHPPESFARSDAIGNVREQHNPESFTQSDAIGNVRELSKNDRVSQMPENDDSTHGTDGGKTNAEKMHRPVERNPQVDQHLSNDASNRQAPSVRQTSPGSAENLIQAMMTEVNNVTADDVEGEIMSYQAMFHG
jgi:hypothetical protein